MKIEEGVYAMYLRKSRADEEKERYGHFETLAKHEQQLSDLCRSSGYVVDEVFKEIVSGESVAERFEFQRLMEKVANREYSGVVVHAVDRLGRGDPMEYGWILSTLKYTKTVIVTPQKVYDPNDSADYQSLQLQMFVSQIELENIKRRLKAGSRISAMNGCYLGSKPPFGYDKVKVEGKHTLKPNDDAETVRLIFQKSAGGQPHGSIAREFNEAGMRTPCGGMWASSRITTIVQNPVYKGIIRYGYRTQEVQSRDGFKFKKKTAVHDDCIMAQGIHEPLVSEEVWEEANARNTRYPPMHKGSELLNPLSGLIFCKKCGRAIVRHVYHSKSGREYVRMHHANYSDCKCRSTSLHVVMGVLVEALQAVTNDLEITISENTDDTHRRKLEVIENAIQKEDAKLEKLIELYYADAINIEEFKRRREESERRASELRLEHAKCVSAHRNPIELSTTVRQAIALLNDDDIRAEDKNRALKQFVSRIEYENLTTKMKEQDVRLTIVLK